LGRSRGGFSSKILVTATDENTAIVVDVAPGQDHDAPHLPAMLDQTVERLPEVEEVVGDKGFDGELQRQACEECGAKPVIPYRSNSTIPRRLNKKSYRKRNMIERLFGKLKEFRRVATRYEKLKETFLGMIHLVLGLIRLRRTVNVNRT
jgi:transposase